MVCDVFSLCMFQLASALSGCSNSFPRSTGYFSRASYHSNRLPIKKATHAHSRLKLLWKAHRCAEQYPKLALGTQPTFPMRSQKPTHYPIDRGLGVYQSRCVSSIYRQFETHSSEHKGWRNTACEEGLSRSNVCDTNGLLQPTQAVFVSFICVFVPIVRPILYMFTISSDVDMYQLREIGPNMLN